MDKQDLKILRDIIAKATRSKIGDFSKVSNTSLFLLKELIKKYERLETQGKK